MVAALLLLSASDPCDTEVGADNWARTLWGRFDCGGCGGETGSFACKQVGVDGIDEIFDCDCDGRAGKSSVRTQGSIGHAGEMFRLLRDKCGWGWP